MPTHFEDIPKPDMCMHPEHNPPQHIVIPQGKKMVHVCPACSKRQEIMPMHVTCGIDREFMRALENQEDLPPEFQKVIDDNFWVLITEA